VLLKTENRRPAPFGQSTVAFDVSAPVKVSRQLRDWSAAPELLVRTVVPPVSERVSCPATAESSSPITPVLRLLPQLFLTAGSPWTCSWRKRFGEYPVMAASRQVGFAPSRSVRRKP
jgi:hypothetical protein